MTRSQKIRIAWIVAVALAAIAVWMFSRPSERTLRLNACFDNVRGLQAGALVRIAGVDVGRTTSAEAHPLRRDCLAEVKMTLSTPYELVIPGDAVARVENAGLRGAEFIDIDVRNASPSPARDNAFLRTAPTVAPIDAIKAVVDAASAHCSECSSQTQQPAPKKKP